jgi:hypothetical protein
MDLRTSLLRVGGLSLLIVLNLGSARPQVEMIALWPNDDGLSWEYLQTYETAPWAGGEMVENQAIFTFNGEGVVPGGIEVQNLDVEVIGAGGPVGFGPSGDSIVRGAWLARPGLRGAIGSLFHSGAGAGQPPGFFQTFLHEAAYRKTDEEIADWDRNVEETRAWLWLVSDLTIGSEFQLQLVPHISDDVWLYGTMAAWEDVKVPAGVFEGCLRVDYRVDWGESICTDEMGNPTGAFTAETVGFVHYAPDVGPIQSYEEYTPLKEILWGECSPGPPEGEVQSWGGLKLTAGPVGVEAETWGRIKARFSGGEE